MVAVVGGDRDCELSSRVQIHEWADMEIIPINWLWIQDYKTHRAMQDSLRGGELVGSIFLEDLQMIIQSFK